MVDGHRDQAVARGRQGHAVDVEAASVQRGRPERRRQGDDGGGERRVAGEVGQGRARLGPIASAGQGVTVDLEQRPQRGGRIAVDDVVPSEGGQSIDERRRRTPR